jgi:hypothetical protein
MAIMTVSLTSSGVTSATGAAFAPQAARLITVIITNSRAIILFPFIEKILSFFGQARYTIGACLLFCDSGKALPRCGASHAGVPL